MVGAVQVGVFAACVVLFVPMGMAGYHLSRNKMLFFSGALFITLAVGVHLTPYFPSISQFLLPSLSSFPPPSIRRDSCISFLHDIAWIPNSPQEPSWDWSGTVPAISCGFQKLSRSDTTDLLNGSWIFVAGDSQARLFVLALLNLVLDPTAMEAVEGDLFRRHSDYQIVIGEHGVKLDFVWAPYESNLTDVLGKLGRGQHSPDVLVMGTGLWHMLHFSNASEYGASLVSVKRSVVPLLSPISPDFGSDGPLTGSVLIQSPHMFWLGLPTLVNSMLNTDEKKEKMNATMQEEYNRAFRKSKLLHQLGGPFMLLDIGLLSQNCGIRCTADGMHYDGVVYEAALHIMLNALLIESRQRL